MNGSSPVYILVNLDRLFWHAEAGRAIVNYQRQTNADHQTRWQVYWHYEIIQGMYRRDKMSATKYIQVADEALAMLFSNGEHRYLVENGLPEGYTFRGAQRVMDGKFDKFTLIFKNDKIIEDNEINPTFTRLDA
jgi:hypothetical protein